MEVIKKQLSSHNCIICGIDNKFGLRANFYHTKDNKVVTRFRYKEEHQSYPGRAHGGMITAMLDELVGRAIWIDHPEIWGVTIKLEMTYRKPVPLETDLYGVGWIESETSRTFSGKGYISTLDGTILAECSAVYMKLPLSKISEQDEHEQLLFVPDDVTEI